MTTITSVAAINSNQLDSAGSSVVVNTSGNALLFNYVLFPADNATGTTNQNIISKTVNVGTDSAVSVTSGVYHLFVDTSAILCDNTDLSVKVRVMGTDGVYSEFADPVTLYLTPGDITLDRATFKSSDYGYNYLEGGRLNAYFEEDSCNEDYVIKYNLCVQYKTGVVDGDEYETQYRVYENLEYSENGIFVDINGPDAANYDGVREDSLYLAVQGVRLLPSDQEALGPLSNTVQALDAYIPDAPVLLRVTAVDFNGDVNAVAPNPTDPSISLAWNAPPSAAIKVITKYYLYRTKNDEAFDFTTPLAEVDPSASPVLPGAVTTYTDDDLSSFVENDIIRYTVKSVDATDPAAPEVSPQSNVASQTWVIPSSVPQNLQVSSLLDKDSEGLDSTNVTVLFNRPATINGQLAPPDVGDYSYDYYQTVGGYIFVIEYQESGASTWNPLGTFQRDYTDESLIQENFNDLALVSESSTIRVTVNLTTYFSPPTVEGLSLPGFVPGFEAAATSLAASLPIITDINGVDGQNQWTFSEGLVSFNVYSYGPLVGIKYNNATVSDTVAIFGLNIADQLPTFQQVPIPTPEQIPEDYYYGEYAGAFKYSFVRNEPGFAPLTITCANVSGAATSSRSDASP